MSDDLSEVAPKIRFIFETANKNREYIHFLLWNTFLESIN